MNASIPKPLQKVGGKTMLERVVQIAREIFPDVIVVVIGNEQVEKAALKLGCEVVWQKKPLGTADALLKGLLKCSEGGSVVVTCVDVPLVKGGILEKLVKAHKNQGNWLTVLTSHVKEPYGYGRVIKKDGYVLKIIEEKEATVEEKKVNLINGGIYCIKRRDLEGYLKKITKSKVSGEYYLTDIVEIANNERMKVGEVSCDFKYIQGVNNLDELKKVEELFKRINYE